MPEEREPPAVVFRVRFGKELFTCRGHLVWEGGIVYAITEEMPDDCPFVPDRLKLEESDLELQHDDVTNRDWYQYHGFVVVS
jgi:hypothetical protein